MIVPVYTNKYVIKNDTKNKKREKDKNFESFLISGKLTDGKMNKYQELFDKNFYIGNFLFFMVKCNEILIWNLVELQWF